MSNRKPFFADRIGGIPTVLQRMDESTNRQEGQYQTMKEAKEVAQRRNLVAELNDQQPKF